jgi:FAD/FMN-containing dehydrogenase
MPTVTNWFGDLVSNPSVIAEVNSVDDIVAVMKDRAKYPEPVRAVGSSHSCSPCAAADQGTLVQMSNLNRILSVGSDTVTVEGGALYIDIAKELEKRGLQHYINTEIGNLSAGSAASCGTKDASMPGEFGQVGSYVTHLKMVLPSGDILEVDESQADLMAAVRSSYGTFGIVTEVTFRIRPLLPMKVYHETYNLADLTAKLPALIARNESMMYYVFPFDDAITIEFRSYNPGATGEPNRVAWPLRNYLWGTTGPAFCRQVEADIPDKKIRYGIIDGFCGMWRFKLENLIRSDYTIPGDQMIRYPDPANDSRYTFSFWAFPEERFPQVLSDYFQFSRDYYQQKGYRINMLSVGYRVLKDQNALLSYSYDGNMMTVDPVSTANPGWWDFLGAYNASSSASGGRPLFNQTWGLTRDMAQKAYGPRWDAFAAARAQYDPKNRMLNDYFATLLGFDVMMP